MRKDDLARKLFGDKDYFTHSFTNKVKELENQLHVHDDNHLFGWYSDILVGYLEHLEKCIVAMKEEAAKINQKSNDEWEEECIKVMDDSGNVHRCIVRMLKSCSYCGRIHDIKHQCSSKHTRNNKVSKADRFRWTSNWQRKRKQVREDRDLHMCQVCIRELYDTQTKYNFDNIQVHHIVPLNDPEGWDKRLDENYLISLCYYHHCLAENGEIPSEELLQIVREQEEKYSF